MNSDAGALRYGGGVRPGGPSRGGRWRRGRRVALAAVSLALVPVLVSYVSAVTAPSNSSIGIRSVEWMRDHGAAGLVSSAESLWYSLNAPSKGGPALRALPQQGGATITVPATPLAAASPRPGGRPAAAKVAPAAPVAYRPAPIAPVITPALPGEGVWHATRAVASLDPALLVTSYRAEPDYPRLVTAIAWINTHRTTIALYPGLKEPSVTIPRGTMDVPPSLRRRLLATFNSGFKLKDARGGFALNGHTYAPMQPGMATLLRYRSGRVSLRDWNGGPDVASNVVFARQNLPLIVNQGQPNPNLGDGPAWGATLGNAIRVWRSAVGIDRHGNLLYVAANDQTVSSIARALVHAGAVRAMELDINSYWVSFNMYRHRGALGASSLLPSMSRPDTRYLSPDDRDFFAVYAR